MKLVRARNLLPGDRCFYTSETAVRVFTDPLTPQGKVNILWRKGVRERLATYVSHRVIRVFRDATT